MKSISLVEVDVDYCSLTYGEGACTAQLSGLDGNALNQNFQNSAGNGWTGTNLVTGDDALTILQTSTDSQQRSGTISVNGAINPVVYIDIERTVARSAGIWDGKIFYSTAGHGESASYYKQFPAEVFAQLEVVGNRFTFELDMAELTAGGNDWITNTITGIRLDFDQANNAGAFKLYSVRIGPRAPATVATNPNPNLIDFDGTNDYLRRVGGLTGAADGKRCTFSVWVDLDGATAARFLSGNSSLAGGSGTLAGVQFVAAITTNKFAMSAYNSAGTIILNVDADVAIPTDGGLVHLMCSFDLASTSKRHMCIDGVEQALTVTTYTNDTIDFTVADWSIGAWADGGRKIDGRMAELWMHPTYIDLSVEANREMFRTSDGRPVYLGADGSRPLGGTQPLIYLGNAFGSFQTNLGSGGNFSVTGALADGGTFSTGDEKCFNCRFTCQDIANYTEAGATLRFGVNSTHLPITIDCDPSIEEIKFTPATIEIGRTIGGRASLEVTLADHRHPDTGEGFDKYYAERPFNPYDQGTIFGKLRARHPFLQGRNARLIRGLDTQALDDMDTRHFIVEDFSGPGFDGRAQLTAKDILKLADDDRAEAPALSNGSLLADLTNSQTTLVLTPEGVGDEYDATGYFNLGGKEIVSYSRQAIADLLVHTDVGSSPAEFRDVVSNRAVTVGGNAQTSSAQSVFGAGSLLLDGVGDYIQFASNAIFQFGTDDWIVDCRCRTDGLTVNPQIIWDYRSAAAGDAAPTLAMGVTGNAYIRIEIAGSSVVSTGTTFVSANTWYHVVATKKLGVIYLIIDGAVIGSAANATNLTVGRPRFGCRWDGNQGFDGYIDEIRSKKGLGFSTYAVPTAAYNPATLSDLCTITRAQLATTAETHDAGDRVQQVLAYEGVDPADIIYDLLLRANVDASYMSLADWQTETGVYFGSLFTGYVADPKSINDLLDEIMDLGFLIWWDDVSRMIKLQVLRQISSSANIFDDDTRVTSSALRVMEQPEKRVSRVTTYFAKQNPLIADDELSNYSSVAATIDTDAELDYGVPAIRTRTTRWIALGGTTIAERCNENLLSRYRDPPRRFNFGVWRTYNIDNDPSLGGGYYLQAWCLQLANGSRDTVPIQITRLNPLPDIFEIEAEEVRYSGTFAPPTGDRTVTIDTNVFNINLRDIYDALYATPQSGDTITFIINSGVYVGSTSTSLNACEVGSWPSGVNVDLIVNGIIQGHGGDGAGTSSVAFIPGTNGGPALYTRQAITISGSGAIYAGAGGGGVNQFTGSYYAGGGGAGTSPGSGGIVYGSNAGADGTATAGGAGGFGAGGPGGNPGLDGTAGNVPQAPRGLKGNAIDGVSHCTIQSPGPTITGSQVN